MENSNVSVNFILPKSAVIVSHKVVRSSKPIASILTWEGLLYANSEGLLPKGYLTRCRNGHVSLASAKAYLLKLDAKSPMPITLYITTVPNQNNMYCVVYATNCRKVA